MPAEEHGPGNGAGVPDQHSERVLEGLRKRLQRDQLRVRAQRSQNREGVHLGNQEAAAGERGVEEGQGTPLAQHVHADQGQPHLPQEEQETYEGRPVRVGKGAADDRTDDYTTVRKREDQGQTRLPRGGDLQP